MDKGRGFIMESCTQASKTSFFRLWMRHLGTFNGLRTGSWLAFVFLVTGVLSLSATAISSPAIGFENGLTLRQEQAPPQQGTPPQQLETPPQQQETPPPSQEQAPLPQESAAQESAANVPEESTTSATAATSTSTEEAANATESSSNPVVASPEELQFQEVVLGKADPTLQDLRQLQQRVNSLLGQLRPAVVGIRMGGGQGSGVLVSGDGFVLTAAHVVGRRGQRAEIVMPDGSTHPAIVLGTDAASDSGMLRMVEKGPWPYAEIGESESLKRGQWLLALGHPGGYDPERSSVVRVGRLLADPGRTTLQTDCTLVGGDSGGPLFDLEGRVVGIHSRISRRIQQNYHVSVDMYTSEWDEMSKDPTPTLGFRIKSAGVTDQLLVDRVTGDGPADKAGLKANDQILRFNGEEVKNRDELRVKLGQLQNGQKIKIVVLRDNVEVEVELQVELK
ncbi:MAG: S1C family serine protease [Pirellulaceae bacterium]|nr:S1C family serine protease [Pirellulaceae bacterium]